MSTAIKISNVSKLYRLGTVGTGTISHDLNRWWHRIRGKEDPYAKVGQVNDRSSKSGISGAPAPDYVWALKDINLDVEQGDILGIIGRNGAGKSTLLKLLSRVTAPSTGTIKTRGRIASLLEVGTGFHPELTGRENIYLNGSILGMRRTEISSQLDAIIEFSGCAKYLDTPVKRYSSGMMVRLGFAVAAHLQCEILIVDEVLAVGDAEFQRRCIGKLKDVAQSGDRTVLFVSHNMTSVQALTTRCCNLENGTVQFTGPSNEAIARYLRLAKRTLNTDFSNTRRRNADWGHQARINSVAILDKNSVGIYADQPIDLVITIGSDRSFQDTSIGITIFNDRELPICSGFSNAFSLEPDRQNRIQIQLPGQFLAPGSYSFAMSIFQGAKRGGRRNIDVVHEGGPIEILPATNDNASLTKWDNSYGSIMLPNITALYADEPNENL